MISKRQLLKMGFYFVMVAGILAATRSSSVHSAPLMTHSVSSVLQHASSQLSKANLASWTTNIAKEYIAQIAQAHEKKGTLVAVVMGEISITDFHKQVAQLLEEATSHQIQINQIAQQAGVSRYLIYDIEKPHVSVSREILAKVYKAIKELLQKPTPHFLLSRYEERFNQAEKEHGLTQAEVAKIAKRSKMFMTKAKTKPSLKRYRIINKELDQLLMRPTLTYQKNKFRESYMIIAANHTIPREKFQELIGIEWSHFSKLVRGENGKVETYAMLNRSFEMIINRSKEKIVFTQELRENLRRAIQERKVSFEEIATAAGESISINSITEFQEGADFSFDWEIDFKLALDFVLSKPTFAEQNQALRIELKQAIAQNQKPKVTVQAIAIAADMTVEDVQEFLKGEGNRSLKTYNQLRLALEYLFFRTTTQSSGSHRVDEFLFFTAA